MRYYNIIGFTLVSALALLSSCVGVEPIELQSKASDHYYRPSDYKGIVLKDQILFDFREGLNGWWADRKYNMSLQGTAMKIMVNGAGPKYAPFGVDLSEPMNFENAPVIRVKVRLPESSKPPVMRLDLRDANGKFANAAPATNTLKVSGEDYYEYFFDLNHKWKQSYPNNADVDPTQIDRLQFFINPGGDEYYGSLFIDEIYVMANKDGSGIVDKNIILDDFSNGGAVDLWWPCKPEKVSVSVVSDAMKIHFENGEWDCFGKIFGETDVTNNPIIRIKARAESGTAMKMTNVMARFIDVNENSTDLIDGENMSNFEIGGSDYQYYYSAFKTKYENNLYSSQGDFDPTKVNRVIIFFNMNIESNFTGDVYVQEVAFVSELPDKQKIARSPWGAPPALDPKWKKANKLDNSAYAKAATWKVTSGNVTKSEGATGGVKFSGKSIGKNWEELTATITPFNLDSMVVIRVRAKATGNTDATIRLDVVDDNGNQTNGRPQEFVVKQGADFKDYYVNMSTNYYQRIPSYKIVNVGNVSGFKMYINPGMTKGFDGDLEISEIQPMTLKDAPEEIRSIFE